VLIYYIKWIPTQNDLVGGNYLNEIFTRTRWHTWR
jgi:hypothetical protein